jgi:hypothetical protein
MKQKTNCRTLSTDECSDTFLHCNSVFASCTVTACDHAFPGTDMSSLLHKLGCQRIAATFNWIVESEVGRKIFDFATADRCTCCPEDKPVSCADGCTDKQIDSNNCGTCGHVCASGKCQNGVCSEQTCDGKTCGNFANCGGGTTCLCFTAADGTGFCATGSQPCSGLPACTTNANCPSGSICSVQSCCRSPVCIPIDCPNPSAKLRMMARRGHFEGATPASPGVFVE